MSTVCISLTSNPSTLATTAILSSSETRGQKLEFTPLSLPNHPLFTSQVSPPATVPQEITEPRSSPLKPFPDNPLQQNSPENPLIVPSPDVSNPNSSSDMRITVKKIEILGSTVFSQEELQQAVAPFIGQEASFEDLLTIRTLITKLYTDNGYTTSGAFLPSQDVTEGIVRVQVVEGSIEQIEVAGLKRLRPGYVRSRLASATTTPVNIQRLEEVLRLLQLDPLLKRVDGELKSGTTPGTSILTLNLEEARAFQVALEVNNYDSPSVGSIRGTGAIEHKNLLGFGDRFLADYGVTEGVDIYRLSYQFPTNPLDGKFSIGYENNQRKIVEEPFDELDINSDSSTFSLGFRQPLWRTPSSEFALGISLDLRKNQTFLFGDIPFSFSPGPENGKSRITALRLNQDWLNRTSNTVLAARSQFSFGLDLFDATINEDAPDGRFTHWLGQFQWVQSLGGGTILLTRLGTQLSFDSLLPLEQFGIGGVNTVRGYRQNQRVGDNAFVGSVELRFPLVKDNDDIGTIELTPFFDFGTVWNHQGSLPNPNTLVSVGLGLRWQIAPFWFARLDWGIPLNNLDNRGDTLQDNGITFLIRFQP